MFRSRTSGSMSCWRGELACAETDVFTGLSFSAAQALQVLLRVLELRVQLHGRFHLGQCFRLLAFLLQRLPQPPARGGPALRADLGLDREVVPQVALGARRL